MRPSPDEVRRWFSGEIDQATYWAHITTLKADPNWIVSSDQRAPDLWLLSLYYGPWGERLYLPLQRRTYGGRVTWHLTEVKKLPPRPSA